MYYEVNSYIFINEDEVHKFKAKDSEINVAPLWLGKVSKDFLVENMKKTRLYGYVYEFSIDYVISIDDILDIHKYLIKKNNIYVWTMAQVMFEFTKNVFIATIAFIGLNGYSAMKWCLWAIKNVR